MNLKNQPQQKNVKKNLIKEFDPSGNGSMKVKILEDVTYSVLKPDKIYSFTSKFLDSELKSRVGILSKEKYKYLNLTRITKNMKLYHTLNLDEYKNLQEILLPPYTSLVLLED